MECSVCQVIPRCPICPSIMKPNIVFFGESLPEEFHHQMEVDKDDCDLLIVIGSSLKVRPVALIPRKFNCIMLSALCIQDAVIAMVNQYFEKCVFKSDDGR